MHLKRTSNIQLFPGLNFASSLSFCRNRKLWWRFFGREIFKDLKFARILTLMRKKAHLQYPQRRSLRGTAPAQIKSKNNLFWWKQFQIFSARGASPQPPVLPLIVTEWLLHAQIGSSLSNKIAWKHYSLNFFFQRRSD